MPDELVWVPLIDPRIQLRVIALYKGRDPGPFGYLQGMRSGSLKALNSDPEKTEAAKNYHRNEQKYFENLAHAVPGPLDAILSPPSDFGWQSEPYRKKVGAKYKDALDLTDAFSRTGLARAGKGASLTEVLMSLSYAPCGKDSEFRQLAIVDDTFTKGTTAAALVLRLREHGLPETCNVIVACPLWLDTA